MSIHPIAAIHRPRTLSAVLADLREARRDLDDALCDCANGVEDADDRATEANTRCDDLRDEFDGLFARLTGLTFAAINDAIVGAVL
jgi:hypothetical protein